MTLIKDLRRVKRGSLERVIEPPHPMRKIAIDTVTNLTASIAPGLVLDMVGHMSIRETAVSRGVGLAANAFVGGAYGAWRDFLHRCSNTNQYSSLFQKYLCEIAAFATFQAPLYGGVVGVGSFIADGHVNWSAAVGGAARLAVAGLVAAPIFAWYSDFGRRLCKVRPATENVYEHYGS